MDIEREPQESEISLMDLLLVVAENIKLLILGPLLVGLVALGIGFTLPQSFVSQAILAWPTATPTPQQAAAMMVSPLVLDPIIETHQLSDGKPIQAAREALAKQVKATVGKDGLLRLDVTDTSAVQAQVLANAVIDGWLKSTVPGVQERQDLEKRLEFAQNGLKSVTSLIERLSVDGVVSLAQPLTRGEAGTSLVAVGELQARYLSEVIAIPRALQGLSRDVVKQPPTLPTEPVAPKKSLMAVLAALGSGFALLLFVFMRQAWKNAAADPEAALKQNQLRRALGLKIH
ncbi:hypothetical protein LHU53_09395 [Rhodoferax sp. U2-2l]|uniref:hypothetical protein n=1 Tax=Rhodoferax sp. U2-2l TaxID=2884000 RepID=UPI001D09DFB5|nr:hypothetical protein [Rhodoferax sp. U2-2l]MCB8747119.1 hypothetical protein [Rhodoferax sp. U2-2l]